MDATSAGPRLSASGHGNAEFHCFGGSGGGFSLALAEPDPAVHAARLLQTLASFPRRQVPPAVLTAAQRRARWQRAKLLYRIMRGMTGILVRLALYGAAHRLVCAARGGPFRRRRTIPGPIGRPIASATPPADTRAASPDQPAVEPAYLARGRVIKLRAMPF